MPHHQIDIDSGRLAGRPGPAGVAFLGIPYAAAMMGRHRFQAPQPVAPWAGVRGATSLGARCPQRVENIEQLPVFAWYAQGSAFDEDCCVLNVFTPAVAPSARRPVLVYVHGGGYAAGGGGGPALDGGRLAAFGDLVVVTVNHRLNVFGYSNLGAVVPGAAAGEAYADAAVAGHLDLVAALQWVKRNIAAFGGDPDNVTLAGQSGGGNKVMGLMTMPAARGLYRRVINMSGVSGLAIPTPSLTERYVHEWLRQLGVGAADLGRLRDIPAEALLAARDRAMAAARMDGTQPVVDGRHIVASPFSPEGLALQADVPLMIGVTDTEATLFLGQTTGNFTVDAADLSRRVRAQFDLSDREAGTLIEAYRDDGPRRSPADLLAYLASDVLTRGPLLRAAETKAKTGGAPVYVYHFAWQVPEEGGVWRSPHTADIPFAFGTLECARCMTGRDAGAVTRAERVSLHLMSAFAAFARGGSPNDGRLPHWPAYDAATRPTMVIDETCRLVNDPQKAGRLASAPLLSASPADLRRGPLFRGVR